MRKTIESIISNQQADSTAVADSVDSSLAVSRPPLLWLRVTFLFASRFDQASRFRLKMRPICSLSEISPFFGDESWIEHRNPAGVNWKRFTKFYPIVSPMQGVKICCGGKDESDWAGHYGAKIANVSMMFVTRDEVTDEQIGGTISRL